MKHLERCILTVFKPRYSGSVGAFLVPFTHPWLMEPILDNLTGSDSECAWTENILNEAKYPLVYGETVEECINKLNTEHHVSVYGECGTARHDFMCDFLPEMEQVFREGLTYANGKALLLKFNLNPYQF